MNNFIFENATKVFFGEGCVREYLRCLVKHYGDTVMLAYGGGSVRENGVYEEVTGILAEAGKTVVEFSGIMPNPTYAKVLEGAQLARDHHVGLILGVGGGSVMDCCKAVSVAARYDGDAWEEFWGRPGVMEFEPLPVGVIVTVAGTGSECNGGAVITNEALNVKTGRDYPKCNPKFALLDPTYTYSVPKFQMVSGSFDILSHIMEIYFSGPDEDNVSDDIAKALMKNVIRNLRASIADPHNYTARSNLMWFAVNVWGISAEGKTEEEIALAGIGALENFILEIGLPVSLRELGIDEKTDLKEIADSCAISSGSYKRISHDEILEIFRECL